MINLHRRRFSVSSFNTKLTVFRSHTHLIPNKDHRDIENKDLQKRQTYIQRYKEAVLKKWRNEYLTSLRERQNLKHKKI